MYTKGKWEVVEHSWADTSIICGDKEIAVKSIRSEATEENQEDLESEVSANFKLIAAAPELLYALQDLVRFCEDNNITAELELAIDTIKKATE